MIFHDLDPLPTHARRFGGDWTPSLSRDLHQKTPSTPFPETIHRYLTYMSDYSDVPSDPYDSDGSVEEARSQPQHPSTPSL